MNKGLFWSGIGMFALEVFAALIFLLSTLNIDWGIARAIFTFSILALIVIGLNIVALVCVVMGLRSDE